ncbi:phospholipid scramblase 1-like [Ranitomeya variabilis]|uniref:phospholipid scramblase 1-like n=1 Tax=Ranitomeya variabilis TaxID=490064 RepID=UPI004057914B
MNKQEPQNEPVQSQPQHTGSVSPYTPAPMPSSLQGLEYLSQVSQMVVEIRSPFLLYCRRIIHDIKNSMGQQVYTVTEDFDCPYQYFCAGNRSVTRRMTDNTGGLVMEVYKPFEYPIISYCQKTKPIEVKTASGVPMAYIVAGSNPWLPTIKILNENKDEVLKITRKQCCTFSSEMRLKITTVQEKREVGRITLLGGFCSIKYDVLFSLDLDVKMKAAILATCLLFDA